jgi:hypothetical protein
MIKTTTSRVLYPDDLKLMRDTDAELQTQLQAFKNFIDVMNTEFGRDNCVKSVLKKGKLIHSHNLIAYIGSTEDYKGLNKEKFIRHQGI